jgi:NDP-sugar pyrophosphorylase family protein
LVHQTVEDVPEGCAPPKDRVKPLGTAHALWCCRHIVQDPFLVINADDFYGASTFRSVRDFLLHNADVGAPHPYCMAAYELANTVSEHGSVSRGICALDDRDNLCQVVERTRIERRAGGLCAVEDAGLLPLADDTPVSLNTWGFHPSVFRYIEDALRRFLGQPMEVLVKAECYLPWVVGTMLERKVAYVRALMARDRWIGITYMRDHASACRLIADLVTRGEYPESLWN